MAGNRMGFERPKMINDMDALEQQERAQYANPLKCPQCSAVMRYCSENYEVVQFTNKLRVDCEQCGKNVAQHQNRQAGTSRKFLFCRQCGAGICPQCEDEIRERAKLQRDIAKKRGQKK